MSLPVDYVERVYAGVLGKVIGVYLGRPFEGWTYERIIEQLGEVEYYVNDRLKAPLVVTDDDISGTFTFLRALEDYGYSPDITSAQIGQTWLNYIIENKTILWWGGMGNSTEHTAFLRLKHGHQAPESGSAALNSKIVSEQIGAQIFIDGWAMVSPADPERAAGLAHRAASVSHDCEAVYASQVLAAMEAQAFVESDIDKLLNCGVSFIPRDSVIYTMIERIRDFHSHEPDWHAAREMIASEYGYDKFAGVCHVVPNHAIVILALLYGAGDFSKSLRIANTSGWDTDCNSGNVGCLLGIRNGLSGLDNGPDWRGPVADRLYLPTADAGGTITDAVSVAYRVAAMGAKLSGEQPAQPKQGARYHFEMPGSTQGFVAESPNSRSRTVEIENAAGHSAQGTRSLAIRFSHVTAATPIRVLTPTFISPEAAAMKGYGLIASPTLYPGQTLRARLEVGEIVGEISARLFIRAYGANDQLEIIRGPRVALEPDTSETLYWTLPDTDDKPVAQAGIEIDAPQAASGVAYLDYLTWEGEPKMRLTHPPDGSKLWQRAWATGVDSFGVSAAGPHTVSQNEGTGLLIHGARDWRNMSVSADISISMSRSAGIAARVQGMKRYYALLLCHDNIARLVRVLDGDTVLAESPFTAEFLRPYRLELCVNSHVIRGLIDGQQLFEVEDREHALDSGAIAIVCEEGTLHFGDVQVHSY